MLNIKINEMANAKAIVVINHGFAEHVGRYDWVVQELNLAGYSCVRYDLRGHGETDSKRGHIDSYEQFISDCEYVVDLAQALDPSKDVFILGHSMGGLVSVMAALSFPDKIKGQVLSGPGLRDLPAVRGIRKPMLSFISKVAPNLMLPNPVTNQICSDIEVVNGYKADPLVLKKASARFLCEFTVEASKFVDQNIHQYDLPVLIVHGEKDSIVPVEIGQFFFDSIASVDKEFIVYEGLYHEILNEKSRGLVMSDIIAWLDSHASY